MIEKQRKYRAKEIFIKYRWTLLFAVAVLGGLSLFELADIKREPLWQSIKEYQRNIELGMIIDVTDERYLTNALADWKVDELAIAMATAESYALNHPIGYRSVIVQMDTVGTEIEPNVRVAIATEGKEKKLRVYFSLRIMRNGKSYASVTFAGQNLNNWARSVGIVREQN